MNLSNIRTNWTIYLAWAQPQQGYHGSEPYQSFWESNMVPAHCVLCRDVLTHYKLNPTIFSTPAATMYTCRDFSHDCLDNFNLPRSIHEVDWLPCIHGWQSSLVLKNIPCLSETIPSPSPYITFIFPSNSIFNVHVGLYYSSLNVFRLTIPYDLHMSVHSYSGDRRTLSHVPWFIISYLSTGYTHFK